MAPYSTKTLGKSFLVVLELAMMVMVRETLESKRKYEASNNIHSLWIAACRAIFLEDQIRWTVLYRIQWLCGCSKPKT